MTEIKKVLRVDKLSYYETHLSLINCIIPNKNRMTPMEIKVLATFMALEGEMASYRFSTIGRKIVMNSLELSASGLSGYIRTLSDKELIVGERDKIIISSILIPEPTQQDYRFRLIKNINIEHATTSEANMLSQEASS